MEVHLWHATTQLNTWSAGEIRCLTANMVLSGVLVGCHVLVSCPGLISLTFRSPQGTQLARSTIRTSELASNVLSTWDNWQERYMIVINSIQDIDSIDNLPDTWDHSGYGLSQWEDTLPCYAFSHWLRPYPNDEKTLFCCLPPEHGDR